MECSAMPTTRLSRAVMNSAAPVINSVQRALASGERAMGSAPFGDLRIRHPPERVDEAEPADERLRGAPLAAQPAGDRGAVEVQLELHQQESIAIAAGLVGHHGRPYGGTGGAASGSSPIRSLN